MSERAGSKHTVVVNWGSHVVMLSEQETVADILIEATKK
jgi:hypothetical protein